MDSKLYYEYNNLYEILQYDFIKILLKNDCNIYGDILRHIIIDNKTFSEYIENNKSINIWANINLMDIIERDLNEYIVSSEYISENKINQLVEKFISKKVISNVLPIQSIPNKSNKNLIKIKSYHCSLYKKNILLNVLYVDYNSPDILNYSLQYLLDISIDINLLSLSRTGLNMIYIPDFMKNDPVPLYTILNNVKSRKLNILNDKFIYSINTFNMLLKYIQDSWTITNNKLKFISRKNPLYINSDTTCSICLCTLDEEYPHKIKDYKIKDKIVLLPCDHMCHYYCWLHKIKKNLKLNFKHIVCQNLICNLTLDISECFL